MKIDLKQCKLIAHRGLSSKAPENSIAAFKLAAKENYYGIEADIHTTSDHHFMVFHDYTLDRMVGVSKEIRECTYEEVKEYYLTSGSNVTIYSEEKIPRLIDYLSICKESGQQAITEIKYVHDEASLDAIMQIIKELQMLEQVTIISFNLDYLIYLRKQYPTLDLQYLVNEVTTEVLNLCVQYSMNVDVNYGKVTSETIKACHERGILINVWTVDDPQLVQHFIDLGVDFITTNQLFKT